MDFFNSPSAVSGTDITNSELELSKITTNASYSLLNTNKESVVSTISTFYFYFRLLLIITCIIVVTYYAYKCTFDYITTKAFSVTISLPGKVARVGETITLKLSLFKIEENGQEVACSSQQVGKIVDNICLQIEKDNLKRPIAILKSLTQEDGFLIRFSVRASGVYTIAIKTGYFHFVGSPISQEILPGPMFPSETFLNVLNPAVLCTTENKWQAIELNPQDRYKNPCHFDDVNGYKFELSVKFGDTPIDSSEMNHNFLQDGTKLFLNIKILKRNIYKGQLKFDDHPLQHSDFTIVCMSTEEDEAVTTGFNGIFNSLPGPCQGSLLSVGSQKQQIDTNIWVNVNYRQIAISNLYLGLIYYPFIAFRITRRTKILFNGLFEINANENDNKVCLKISDGAQPSVIISIKASDARVLLATFGTFQGQKLTNYEFSDKVQALKSELGGFFPYLKGYTVIQLDKEDVFTSTVNQALETPIDWFKPFTISYKSPLGNQGASTSQEFLTITKWLTLMVQNLFDHQSTGLFSKYKSSRLLHPTFSSRRAPIWKDHHYEFAGSILAKCVYESHRNGLCLKLNHIRFSRSFLAQIVGLPVTYKHFESDDPAYFYKHIKPILDAEDNECNLTFTEIVDRQGLTKINLIPNGSNIPVTKRNKEKYLNLLANHKLKSHFSAEIQAFQSGFYKIIPQGLLTDFDEDELEKILCSGSKGFVLQDLKNNCRIIGNLTDSPGSSGTSIIGSEFPERDKQKILAWFWTVVANMSDSEHEMLLRMTTGSLVLPSCGFKNLNPRFTIALTGNHEMPPTGHPSLHQLCIGNHSSFENFEKNFLAALTVTECIGENVTYPCDLNNFGNNNTTDALPSTSDLDTETATLQREAQVAASMVQPQKFHVEVETDDENNGVIMPWIRGQFHRFYNPL